MMRSKKNQPTQLLLAVYKTGRKENGSEKQSKSCDAAATVEGLDKICEERKKCPALVYSCS